MQIVIDIPEEAYNYMAQTQKGGWLPFDELAKCIVNGIPVKSGHWCKSDGHNFWECSECGSKVLSENPLKDWNFCSRCGAKMFDPQESDHKCHTCKHYISGEQDGSCDSYICKHYSNWERSDKE